MADVRRHSVWHEGLKKVIEKLREVIKTVDKRTIWLKNNYVHQYIVSAGRGPMTADAIRVSDTMKLIWKKNTILCPVFESETYR